jgi:hypothetical protein
MFSFPQCHVKCEIYSGVMEFVLKPALLESTPVCQVAYEHVLHKLQEHVLSEREHNILCTHVTQGWS